MAQLDKGCKDCLCLDGIPAFAVHLFADGAPLVEYQIDFQIGVQEVLQPGLVGRSRAPPNKTESLVW